MSNPAKNSDIEDVLASIRRLVSGDSGAGSNSAHQKETDENTTPLSALSNNMRPVASHENQEVPAEVSGSFLLTPALRVSDPQNVTEEKCSAPAVASTEYDSLQGGVSEVGHQAEDELQDADEINLDDMNVESLIDEDALRELVSDIAREELQGALGERITRNVRKLVRREIHRALAAHDLD